MESGWVYSPWHTLRDWDTVVPVFSVREHPIPTGHPADLKGGTSGRFSRSANAESLGLIQAP